jgi:hypothetical protein
MFFENSDQLRDKLRFNQIEGDDYWSCEGLYFELFFTADKNGPTDKQLETYLDFQEHSIEFVDKIKAKIIDQLEREKGTAPKRFYSDVPMVEIVNINSDKDSNSMDIVISLCTFRLLFYRRWKTYVAKFSGRTLKSVEVSNR